MEPRVSVALAFRENVVCSGGNGRVRLSTRYKVIRLKKHTSSIVVVTMKVLCPEMIENLYLVRRKKDSTLGISILGNKYSPY